MPGEIGLGVLLGRVGVELHALHALSREAEAVLGEVVGGALSGAELCRRAQSLDALTQALGALAGLVERVGAGVPGGCGLEVARVLDGVALGELRARLSGEAVAGGGDELF